MVREVWLQKVNLLKKVKKKYKKNYEKRSDFFLAENGGWDQAPKSAVTASSGEGS